ncbi:sugar transferase [Pelagicoccus sp. SDUM812003]|uniref:sugar transferase n=1 Tax=Pelagicoccus sp. SDUM812003 TaxID=3041267 RepID=UPI00280F2143|nr:sugar transferase [Pelagicoccus sp. SDUM812003]MDQ8203589.1 sugar transferase [Pelagicoccus sp. SDUM812003]
MLLIPDLLLYGLAMLLAFQIRFGFGYEWFPVTGPRNEFSEYLPHFLVGVVVFMYLASSQKLYEPENMFRIGQSVRKVLKVSVLWGIIVLGIVLFVKLEPTISRMFCLVSVFCLAVLLSCSRLALLVSLLFSREWLASHFQKRMAVVGCGPEAMKFMSKINSNTTSLYRAVGAIKTGSKSCYCAGCKACLGSITQDLDRLIDRYDIEAIMIADPSMTSDEIMRVAKVCERRFVDFQMLPNFFEVFTSCLQLKNIEGQPVMGLSEMPQNRILARIAKRSLDIMGSLIGLMISIPIYCVLIPLIKTESPGPVFYKQTRVGQKGRHFTIYKLRSMRTDAEKDGKVGWSTQNDSRRTRVGEFMRKWNLDEIPQFWNVFIGDMSLVGPRPERPELIESFQYQIPYYQSRHAVKPGMTGWAQVHGLRGDTSIEDRIRHDLQYIENWSPWLDVVIQIRTFFNYKGAA